MIIINTPADFIEKRHSLSNQQVGFVPTMGALHSGHSSLIKKSKATNDITVVSIYLNETQFNDKKDLDTYPHSLEEDIALLQELGVDFLFLPNYQSIYPDDFQYKVIETQLSQKLCGKDRPGHFDGVLTVVLKLFNIVQPNKAYFGEKDFQQLELIKGMVQSFFIPVEVIACPIVRDHHGLALSSRNKKLTPLEILSAQDFAQLLQSRQTIDDIRFELEKKGIEIDYLVEENNRRLAAVKIGNVRLIDNVQI